MTSLENAIAAIRREMQEIILDAQAVDQATADETLRYAEAMRDLRVHRANTRARMLDLAVRLADLHETSRRRPGPVLVASNGEAVQ